jgi:type IV pilus assembly protein PilM
MHKRLDRYFSMVRRFLPTEQKPAAVGLDIGAGECKLVELDKGEAGFELMNWGIEPIHNGDIKAAVQKIFSQLNTPCRSLCTSVFGKGTLIRYIDMPRMTLDDLKSSFSVEADKYFPFAQDQIYTDCYILDVKEKEKTMSVMAGAAKRELVDRRTKLLTDLEIPIEFIGLNPVVLANALNVLEFSEGNTDAGHQDSVIALLDMGESVSSLTILVDGLPRFTRDIFVAGRDFTKGISNALGISFQDAEKLKRDPGKELEKVIGACDTVVMNMIQELRLSIDYFATEKNREIGKLLITGGMSMLEGIAEALEKSLEVKVVKWNPLAKIKMAPNISAEDIEKNSLKLGVALGLALYQYD